MLTIVIYAIIAIAVAAAIVALLVIVLPDERMHRPPRDVVPLGLPVDHAVRADDVNRLRLPVAARGYRMVDTDAVLDRLGSEIDRRDREIADLRAAYDRVVRGVSDYARPASAPVAAAGDGAAEFDDDFSDADPAYLDGGFDPAPPDDDFGPPPAPPALLPPADPPRT